MGVYGAEIGKHESVPRLRTGALNLMETVGQSLAAISPTLAPALSMSIVVGLAGLGCWLSFLLGTLGVVIVAASVGVLASRHPEAGSYFVYIGRSFGAFTGALAGWSMISAYMFTAVAVALSFAIFLADFLAAFGIELGLAPATASMLVFIATVTYAAYRDVKLSARVGLMLEVISVGIIIGISAFVVRVKGTVIDPPQLKIAAFHYGGVFSALPFVIFSFVGFESSATLAKESADPRRNIPRAVIGCATFAGIFFTLIAYLMVFGMGDDIAALGKSTAPFGDVATKAGLGRAAAVVYFAAMISVFACCLASVTAAARLLFSMGRYRFLHHSMGLVHDTHRTPHRAILLCGAVVAVVCLAVLPAGLLNAFGYAGTLASFGFVVVYLALCIVAPMDLKKSREMKPRHLLLGAAGAALMLFVVFGSVYPVPEYPYSILPYLFFTYMAIGAIWFAVLKTTSPQTLASIQHDMEG
ncbi:MAG TPA: APC family permease [Steroidobacteraceae bacterium]|nr:APC family permease [Steroidobacteraceae bacterium]